MEIRTLLNILGRKHFAPNISTRLKQIWVGKRQPRVTKGHMRVPVRTRRGPVRAKDAVRRKQQVAHSPA